METKNIDELIAYLERGQKQATQGAQLSLAEVDMLLKHLRDSDDFINTTNAHIHELLQTTEKDLYKTDPNRYEDEEVKS